MYSCFKGESEDIKTFRRLLYQNNRKIRYSMINVLYELAEFINL